jgi:hypothetical protein
MYKQSEKLTPRARVFGNTGKFVKNATAPRIQKSISIQEQTEETAD